MPEVNEITPPAHPMFDKNKYRFPTNKNNFQLNISDKGLGSKDVENVGDIQGINKL